MDTEAVIEFMGCVPLLQRLPTLSLYKIANSIIVKHFARGDFVIREGEADGIYFVWDGEAEVRGSVNADEQIPEFLLKRFDYFGHGIASSDQFADVVALSNLTCLVLSHNFHNLLKPKSIWSADKTHEECSPVENIMHLEPLEVNIFKGVTSPEAPRFGKVFGGQFIGQALAAASKTVDCLKVAHSLHVYFLLAGDVDMPIFYEVHRVRDGQSFATRKVDAMQKGDLVFTLLASFQKDEEGFDHQEAVMPSVPDPDAVFCMGELHERRITESRLLGRAGSLTVYFYRSFRTKVASSLYVPWPIEIRFCEHTFDTNQTKSPPSLRYWFRARGELSDDQALHRCVVAYASDLIFLEVSANPHRNRGLKIISVSLDHSMWFHKPLKADDWLLYVITTPVAYNARGFVSGHMFNQKGELVVTSTQEGLIRKLRDSNSLLAPKL